jgi:hypothetical protein
LFFSVFSIIKTENKLNDKYRIKNIKTDPDEVFFATKNHNKAKTISSSNLTLIETSVCRVWLWGSLDCPR